MAVVAMNRFVMEDDIGTNIRNERLSNMDTWRKRAPDRVN